MKQILFVHAGSQFPDGMFQFLQQMRIEDRIHARGLFFKPVDYSSLTIISPPIGASVLQELDGEEKDIVDNQKTMFATLCDGHHITHEIFENDSCWDKDMFVRER